MAPAVRFSVSVPVVKLRPPDETVDCKFSELAMKAPLTTGTAMGVVATAVSLALIAAPGVKPVKTFPAEKSYPA